VSNIKRSYETIRHTFSEDLYDFREDRNPRTKYLYKLCRGAAAVQTHRRKIIMILDILLYYKRVQNIYCVESLRFRRFRRLETIERNNIAFCFYSSRISRWRAQPERFEIWKLCHIYYWSVRNRYIVVNFSVLYATRSFNDFPFYNVYIMFCSVTIINI